ncbi:MAG: hypothetical protein LKI89_00785 [Olsenella sp.]|nr:hypothetical protein [Olsenella sp.]
MGSGYRQGRRGPEGPEAAERKAAAMEGSGTALVGGGPAADVRTADEIDEITRGLRGVAMALLYAGEALGGESESSPAAFYGFMVETLDGYADRLDALTRR